MKRYLTMAVVAAMGLAFAPAPASLQTADQEQSVETARTVEVNDTDNRSATWTSDIFAGVAPTFFAGGTGGLPDYECGATVENNCEYNLIAVTGVSQAEIEAAVAEGKELRSIKGNNQVVLGITNYSVPVSDLDIIIYESDADGTKGAELGRVGELDTDPSEEFSTLVSTSGDDPTAYLLLEVVFFAGAGTYDGYVNVY